MGHHLVIKACTLIRNTNVGIELIISSTGLRVFLTPFGDNLCADFAERIVSYFFSSFFCAISAKLIHL